MLYGEGVVLRLLDKERMKFDFRSVGMPEEVLKPFSELIPCRTASFWLPARPVAERRLRFTEL